MTRTTFSTAESQRRSQIAAAAYERGRRATMAAANRRSLTARSHTRREDLRSRPHSTELRNDGRVFGVLDTDVSVARAAAYLAACGVAHELMLSEPIRTPEADDWALAVYKGTWDNEDAWRERLVDNGIDVAPALRSEIHMDAAARADAWRERLIDNGIDDAVLRAGLSPDALELPAELEFLDFDDIAEHTLDVSSTAADVEPLRLADLMLDTPTMNRPSESVVDITDRVAQVIELDRGVDTAVEGGVDTW